MQTTPLPHPIPQWPIGMLLHPHMSPSLIDGPILLWCWWHCLNSAHAQWNREIGTLIILPKACFRVVRPSIHPMPDWHLLRSPTVRPSERFPCLLLRKLGSNGLKFSVLIYPDHLRNWPDFFMVYWFVLFWRSFYFVGFLGILWRTHTRNGFKFGIAMYPCSLQNCLNFG